MSKSIESRLEKIEQALSIGKNRLVVRLHIWRTNDLDESVANSLGPVKQWETYKQAISEEPESDLVIFEPDPQKEIEARQRLQNETERNNKPKCSPINGQTG